jgi:molybdopterin converting factor small subunit
MAEEKTITIKMQLYSWISSTIGEENNAESLVEKKIKAGSTLADFFAGLAETFPRFHDFVYNPDDGSVNDEVVIILNNKLVQFSSSRNTVMQDQDTITLSPVLVGG